MKRKDFLRGIGLAGATSMIPIQIEKGFQVRKLINNPPACTLIPSETAGPFPLDLTENQTFFRQDVREDRAGVPLRMKLKVIGTENCEPMTNVRINIWHCDKDGLYSGYNQANNQGQQGLTYLRGYQMTDANGEVEFLTIFPGWYNGRICHIHFQAYVSTMYAAISQLSFPIAEKNTLYTAHNDLYTKGNDPLAFNQDGIFADGYQYQLATLTYNSDTEEYESFLEFGIQGSGTTGLGSLTPETGGYFTLGQNFPNPFSTETTIPFELKQSGDIAIEIYSLTGQRVAVIEKSGLATGKHQISFNPEEYNLAPATFVYQLVYKTATTSFRQPKVMTHLRK